MGSSKKNSWERAGKLLASALKMVSDGSRSVGEWADHLQKFVFGPRWREENGVVYLSVVSDGTTGSGWVKYFKNEGLPLSDLAEGALLSSDFKPTNGVATEIAVLKGTLFKPQKRISKEIRIEAQCRSLFTPNAEVACLILKKFTRKEIEVMGFEWVVIMHEPIRGSDSKSRLLVVDRHVVRYGLLACPDTPDSGYSHDHGFAFVFSQIFYESIQD